MKRNIALTAVLVIVCCCFSYAITAGDKTGAQKNEILVIGSARIFEENMSRARDDALRDAMLKGIENYLITHLGKQQMINNFALLTQEVIPQAIEQIENYHILSQEKTGSVYKIFLSLRINEALMEQKLSELDISALEKSQVKILFLVSEFKAENGEERYWWKDPGEGSELSPIELTLYRVFQDAGFYPVNRLLGTAEEINDSEMMVSSLTLDQAVRWGRLFSADVVIQGRFELGPEGIIDTAVKAINIDHAELITQSNYRTIPPAEGNESASDLDTIEQAVRKMAQKLGPAIIRSMDETKTEMTSIRIDLSGLHNLKQQKLFLDFMKTRVKGVHSIFPRQMKYRSVSFLVDYQGDVESLAQMLTADSGFPFEASIKINNENKISIVIL